MRVAFTPIGGRSWIGGYNYLLNLTQVLAKHRAEQVTPVLFFGTDIEDDETQPFSSLKGVEIVFTSLMNRTRKWRALTAGVLLGCDPATQRLFREQRIDVVFESATFFGWRINLPTIAWIPDFQHRLLPHLFTRSGYWRRELGFRAQTASGRTIMLSSEDSRRACERFFPSTVGRTHVVRFAVPPQTLIAAHEARAVADSYGLPLHFFYMPNQFWKHKNHLLVLDALALLRERSQSVVLAASGHQFDPRNPRHFLYVQAKIEQMGLREQFRLLGLIPYPHLVALMRASVALLNPSQVEGWSTTVEEARSLGVPLVLSDLDVHREQAGNDAIYFDRTSAAALADALQRVQPLDATEREQREQRAARDSMHRVERFAAEFVTLARQCMVRNSRVRKAA